MPQMGTLYTSLTMESSSFFVQIKKAREEIQKTQDKFAAASAKMTSIGNGLKNVAAGFVGGFALAGIEQAIQSGLDYASSLGEVAQQLGITTRTLQEYRYAATQVGIEQSDMDAALGRLTRTLGAADEGAKKQAGAFAALGISVRDSNGHLKTTDTVLPELVAAFSRIEDPARRATLEVDLFGKAGQKLDTLLAGGTGQVDQLRDAASRLGLVLSEEQIANADNTADKLAELKQVLEANIAGAVANNANSIYGFVTALEELAAKVPAAINELGKLRAYLNIGQAVLNGSMSEYDSARKDLTLRQNAGKPFFGDIARDSVAAYSRRVGGGARAGSGGIGGRTGGGRSNGALRTRSGKSGRPSGPTLADETQSIMDRLFPDEEEIRDLRGKANKLGLALKQGLLPVADYDRAIDAIQTKIGDLYAKGRIAIGEDNSPLPSAADTIATGAYEMTDDVKKRFEDLKSANADLGGSFVDMARQSTNAMQEMAQGIGGGDVLGIIQSAIGAFATLGSAGVFGKSIAANLNRGYGGGRATGGPVMPDKFYTVGERGPELFAPGMSGRIIPNHALDQQRAVVQLVVGEGQIFEPRVRGISGSVSVETVRSTSRRAATRQRQALPA